MPSRWGASPGWQRPGTAPDRPCGVPAGVKVCPDRKVSSVASFGSGRELQGVPPRARALKGATVSDAILWPVVCPVTAAWIDDGGFPCSTHLIRGVRKSAVTEGSPPSRQWNPPGIMYRRRRQPLPRGRFQHPDPHRHAPSQGARYPATRAATHAQSAPPSRRRTSSPSADTGTPDHDTAAPSAQLQQSPRQAPPDTGEVTGTRWCSGPGERILRS